VLPAGRRSAADLLDPFEGVVDIATPSDDLGDLVRRETVILRQQLIAQTLRVSSAGLGRCADQRQIFSYFRP
jgi:hypothetical protein